MLKSRSLDGHMLDLMAGKLYCVEPQRLIDDEPCLGHERGQGGI